MGRLSIRTAEVLDEICARIANGETLRAICRDEHMPAWRTVYDWINEDKDFATRIAHARELGFDAIAEDLLNVVDDGQNDWMERTNKDGDNIGWMVNGECVQRSRLRADTRLKLLAKWAPAKYGERQALELSNPDGTLAPQSDSAVAAKLAAILATAQARKDAEENNPGADLV